MPLETSTYISGLTETWPVTGDPKSQGDDHLRLVKSVLKGTFPTATKPFYFPTTEAVSGTITLDATDQNNVIEITSTGGNVVVNLPSTLGVGDKGWSCQVVKVSFDPNAAIVTPASGTISSKCGSTATIRVGILCEPATFTWNGTGWRCSKPGAMIGTTENYDGASIPVGYLVPDGSAFSSTNFAELFAILGSSVVRDKRGRIEAGVDSGVGRLTSTYFGVTAVLGAVGGGESSTLVTANLPAYTPSGGISITNPGVTSHTSNYNVVGGGVPLQDLSGTPTTLPAAGTTTGVFSGNAQGGLSTPVRTAQPTIVVNKIVKAC